MKYQQVELSGHTTAYLEGGDPENDTIVFIHDGAFGTTAELCWGPVMERMEHEYHVLAPELYGWGGSDKHYPFGASPYEYRIQQVAEWLRYKGITNAVFVGASFGGSITLRATMHDDNPWAPRGTISFAGSGGLFRPPAAVEALSSFTPSYEEAERLTSLVVKTTEGLEDHIQQRFENSLIPGHWECLMAPTLRNPGADRIRPADDFPEKLRQVEVPVLFVEGQHDTLLEKGWAEKLLAYPPNGQILVIDASHEPNIDQPDMTAEMIRSFIRSL